MHADPDWDEEDQMKAGTLIGVVSAAVAFTPCPAGAAGDSARGRVIFESWCVSCHAPDRAQTATDAAPSLSDIRQRRDLTTDRLRRWLADPHPPMPNLNLAGQEIEDLVAYLRRKE
ncbi:cytochrome c [Mycobacterium sp. KBS0706]|uniref:c-type cytochrome n=1 Tax=Mycobacterium sp. KBS0706 TaxID=2578109 RepID=UPI00110F7547|nr:cytochrome c [Mycobacterium sp. KBS0706]TSD84042.1 cytochrome c [Mycobacterium sp. KBS0706]